MSAVTTGGTARFTVPATGHVGPHILEILHADFGSPYRNTQQSPVPDRPQFKLDFTITPGAPVLPPPPAAAGADAGALAAAAGRARRDAGLLRHRAAGRGARRRLRRRARAYKLNWNTVVGNRMTGRGWEEAARVDRRRQGGRRRPRRIPLQGAGRSRRRAQPLGRCRRRRRSRAPTGSCRPRCRSTWRAARSARRSASISRASAGRETANIYTVVYDNAIIGYACAFNSQGDVEIIMQATGEPGWHFIDLYPAIYKGKETRPNNYRLPAAHLCGRPSGRGPAALPLRLRGDPRGVGRAGQSVAVQNPLSGR